MRQAEKERKKILSPNSIHTQPGQENAEKDSKKIQKIKKPHSGIIFSENRITQAEKGRKKFQYQIPFILDPGKKIPKKKIKKPHSGIIFRQNGTRQAGKKRKLLVPNLVHTRPGLENSEKKSKKIQKIKKTPFRHYFQPKRDLIGLE